MKKTIDFSNLTRRHMAEICGKTERTITNWVKDGCPRGSNGKFSAPEVIQWLIERDTEELASGSPALEKYREERAKIAKIQREALEDKYVERDWVEQQLAARAMVLKSDMENFFRSRAPEIIVKCDGKQEFAPDVIEYLLTNLEAWLGRYSQPIDPEEK